MATVTPVQWTHKKNKKGLCPIYLRIQSDGKTRSHSLEIYIQESQWSASNQRVKSRQDAQSPQCDRLSEQAGKRATEGDRGGC